AGHPDVAEPPLLLDPLLLDRARVREDALLHADQVDRAELEALRVVQGHERDERAVAADRVLVGVERDLLEEGRESLVFRLGLLSPLSRGTDRSSWRFSMRPCASIVRSASSDSM